MERFFRYGISLDRLYIAVVLCFACLGCERDAVAPEATVAEMVLLDGEIDRSKTSRERWDAALTQSAMNSASLADATEQEERMLRALVAVQNEAATLGVDTEEVLALLKRSQDAWLAHFEAELAFRWPSDVLGGSITPMCVGTDVGIMYRGRAEVLEQLLHGEDGNVCNAQWRNKREHSAE